MKLKNTSRVLKIYIYLLGLTLNWATSSFASDNFATGAIFKTISAIKRLGISEKSVGISVVKLPEVIYPFEFSRGGFNDSVGFNPGSVMKVVTTGAALDLIEKDHRFITEIFTTGKKTKDELKGDIFFKGGGDPKLVVEDLEKIILDLRTSGYRVLSGRWIIDDSLFDIPEVNPSKFDGKPYKPYNVGPSAAMVNFKATEIIIEHSETGHTAKLKPELNGILLKTKLRKKKGGCSRNKHLIGFNKNTVMVRGILGSRCDLDSSFVSLLDHAKFGHALFKNLWENSGGTMNTEVLYGKTPANAKKIYVWSSPRTMLDLVKDINVLSNNPMARNLFLYLSSSEDKPGTLSASRKIVLSWLETKGIDTAGIVLDNGSGLSRVAKMSALDMTDLLVDSLLRNNGLSWIQTFAKAGFEGTASNRFKNLRVAGNAWVKTGSLEGVQACSGYVRASGGGWIAFSIFVNHRLAEKSKVTIDNFVNFLYEES